MMKTVKQVLNEFLKEQQDRVKPGTYRYYDDAMYFFEECLNGYAYQYLDEKDSKRFDKLYEQGKEFCEIFGSSNIGANEISEFLDYFMVKKVMGSKELMKNVGRVMRKFVRWMNEKGYMNDEEFKITAERVDNLKDDLPKVEELASMIYHYTENTPVDDFTEKADGYFRVAKIKPGKLWLENMEGGKSIGPTFVSNEISSQCKVGWVIYLELGKTTKGWQMLESGNVYPW